MKLKLLPCLFFALITTLLAAPPQYTARKDIATNLQRLSGVAVADFNNDGRPDFVVYDANSSALAVYLNQGNGNFSNPIPTTFQASGLSAIVAGDFDEDGKQDLVVSFACCSSFSTALLTGKGDGTFTFKSFPGSSFNVAIATDINHDSHIDYISGDTRNITLALGDGRGSFTFQYLSPPNISSILSLLATDANADHNPDLIFGVSAAPAAVVQLYSGSAGGQFVGPAPITTYTIFNPTTLSTADFNGDGKLDLLMGANPNAGVVFGNGDGTFQPAFADFHKLTLPPGKIQGPALTAIADVNADNKPDIIVVDGSSETMDVFVNDGTGTFTQTTPDFTADVPIFTEQMRVADFNGDGLPDVVMTTPQNNVVSLFFSIFPKATPTVTLTSTGNSQFVNSSLTFDATVVGANNKTPTGTVTFVEGTTTLAQQPVDSNGLATYSTSSLAAGQHTITATYSGDANYLSRGSSPVIQSVTDFQIALLASSQTVTAGGTATYSLTITPTGGLTGSVSIACSQLPLLSSCDPITVPINGQPVTATLPVHTTAPVTSRHLSSVHTAGLGLFSIVLATLLPLRTRKSLQLLIAAVALVAVSAVTGCSGGKAPTADPPVTVTPGTPQGTTPFTITSSITLGGQTLARTTNATLVVQ